MFVLFVGSFFLACDSIAFLSCVVTMATWTDGSPSGSHMVAISSRFVEEEREQEIHVSENSTLEPEFHQFHAIARVGFTSTQTPSVYLHPWTTAGADFVSCISPI